MRMSSIGLQLYPLLLLCFGFSYLLNHIFNFISFFFPHFAHVDVLVCPMTTPVIISFLMERVSSKLCWLPHSLSFQTSCTNPSWHHIVENLSKPPALPYINFVLGELDLFLNCWTLKMGLIGCLETSVGNYHYLLCNNPEQHSSHILRSESLKSRLICSCFK